MVIGTALGFSDLGTIVLAVALAFLFGYALTSLPLLRSGMALPRSSRSRSPSDTVSIATMEIVDNVIMLVVPGAMDAGLDDPLFWGSLAVALLLAGVVAVPGQPLADRARQGPRGGPRGPLIRSPPGAGQSRLTQRFVVAAAVDCVCSGCSWRCASSPASRRRPSPPRCPRRRIRGSS